MKEEEAEEASATAAVTVWLPCAPEPFLGMAPGNSILWPSPYPPFPHLPQLVQPIPSTSLRFST